MCCLRMRSLKLRCLRVVYSLQARVVFTFLFLLITINIITQKQVSTDVTVRDSSGTPQTDLREATETEKSHSPPPGPAPPLHHHHNHHLLSQDTHSDWVEAKGSKRDFFFYSAYLDRRGANSQVIIIAIVKRKKTVKSCQIRENDTITEVTAKIQKIHENWNLLYSAALILCPVSKSSKPDRVALSPYPETSIPVQDMSARELEGRMSVCVKPIHYQYDRAVWLVEFIEFYRLLGADKFILYNHTMGPTISQVVQYYMKENLVTLLQWPLPVITQKEIRTEGIFAALNDCNLRSVNRFTFSVMVDLDEFLIPRHYDTLTGLLDSYGKTHSSYVFQNVFFYLYWENDTAAAYDRLQQEGVSAVQGRDEPYLLTAFKTRRLSKPHKIGVRSKYVVRPERVLELGNHIVWSYIGAKRTKNVPVEEGLSHHYRICEFGGFDCLKQENEVDRTAHTWLPQVYQMVTSQCSKIFPQNGSCPPAPPLGSPW